MCPYNNLSYKLTGNLLDFPTGHIFECKWITATAPFQHHDAGGMPSAFSYMRLFSSREGVVCIETIQCMRSTIIQGLICTCTNRVAAETIGCASRSLLSLSLTGSQLACWAPHVWSVGTISTISILITVCNGQCWACQPPCVYAYAWVCEGMFAYAHILRRVSSCV